MDTNDQEKLQLLGLPNISSVVEFANLLLIDEHLLLSLLTTPRNYYKVYTIPKSRGGKRVIQQPTSMVKGIQAWILRNILDKIKPTEYATAYQKGKNIKQNVNVHKHNDYFACLDLEDFFPSISLNRVQKQFIRVGYSENNSRILALICTVNNQLPQGAITSPAISNLIASQLDKRIAGYASKLNIEYTRYADDITLSCKNKDTLRHSLKRVFLIIKAEHFVPNLSKTRVLGPGQRCEITGLIKNNDTNEFVIGRKQKRVVRSAMYRFITSSSKKSHYDTVAKIEGWLNYLKGVDPIGYDQMQKYWLTLKEK